MVDMGVGQQHEIDLAHVEAEIQRPEILAARLRPALEHAAIHQKPGVPRLHQRARPGHLAGRTEKAQTHVVILPLPSA